MKYSYMNFNNASTAGSQFWNYITFLKIEFTSLAVQQPSKKLPIFLVILIFIWEYYFFQKNCAQYEQVREQFDLRSHEANLCRQRIEQCTHYQLQEDVEALTKTIGKLLGLILCLCTAILLLKSSTVQCTNTSVFLWVFLVNLLCSLLFLKNCFLKDALQLVIFLV